MAKGRRAYVELHARSAFSFLEGASLPEELASRCAELDQPAMAIADAGGVYGAPQFHLAARKLGLRALIGAEVNGNDHCRYTLLAENRGGYRNLCRLITKTKLREIGRGKADNRFATEQDLEQHAEGLVCLTGGAEGALARIYQTSRGPAAEERASDFICSLLRLFGRQNVFVEVQRHFCRKQEARNQALVQLARKMRLPLVATNGVAYATSDKRDLQDLLTCVKEKQPICEAGVLLNSNAERHLKTSEQMSRIFADLPEAIGNACELAERLQFTLSDLGYQFPRYPVPAGESEMSYLRQLTDGGRNRFRNYEDSEFRRKVQRQLEKELALIERRQLPGYFLIVWDLVDYCRREKILVQGRGSAANSAVCYALGITAIDPVRMDLLFERFLSDERDEMPDIDLDLPSGDQRERVIQFVYQRYGRLGAAMTANVITYRGRSAVRDVGKALGFDEANTAKLAAQLNAFEWKDSKDQLEHRFREGGFDVEDPRTAKFFSLTNEIMGLPRHLGQHSGGMVVCQGELDSVVPLEPASMPGRVVVQWDKDDCADLGIIKIDLLGLGMVAVLEESIQIISDSYREKVDLAHLPQEDKKVYECLQKADTIGLFQVESRAQMSCLPRLKPVTFYDIVVQVAIIRPGPIVGQMLHPYLKRRQGLEEPVCLHPSLESVLQRTLGVPLFQEQLIRIAMIAAGFTGGQAEDLRRAFGFKRSEKRMREVEKQLREGMERKGITGETQERIIQAITSFALYGFPESHAASFALLAYASAYLKCHYLPAFTAAMLNNQPMGFYSPATLVKDAQRHGQRFRPVDVLQSDYVCTVEEDGGEKCVRLGLNYVRGLRAGAAREIERQRKIRPISFHA
ncbi:MAG: DNA polymerase III subunit alpha [Bryobacteraceae bacterium]